MDYEKKDIIRESKQLYGDINSCITDLINARIAKDLYNEGRAIFRMEGLMVATMQHLGCVIDFLEEQKECLADDSNASESEDERARKELINFILYKAGALLDEDTEHRWIAYLEKQKENPKSADSIPSDCISDAKCEDRWYKTADFLPDTGGDVLAKDALGNYLLASFDGTQWFVSVYDGEDHPVLHTPPILEWCEIPSDEQEEQKSVENPFDANETMKMKDRIDEGFTKMMMQEQKPVEPSYDELQRHQDELHNFMVFAAKQAREHHISFVHDFEWNNFCAEILSYFNEQKPVDDKAFEEWIDDWWKHNKVNNPDSYDKGGEIQFDEKGFKNFCRGIRNMYQQKPADDRYMEGYTKGYKDAEKAYNESVSYHFPVMPTTPVFGCDGIHCTNPQMDCINCPKKSMGGMFSTASSSGDPTLKAEWKPSEEQMEALQRAIDACESEWVYKDDELRSLLNELKKL